MATGIGICCPHVVLAWGSRSRTLHQNVHMYALAHYTTYTVHYCALYYTSALA